MMVSSRRQLVERPVARELAVELSSALLFLAVALAFAVLAAPTRELDVGVALAAIALYALGTRVEFQMGATWTDASQLILVPMLFLVPTEMVPLFVAAGMLVSRLPEYLSGGVHLQRISSRIADASYSLAPAGVLLVAGGPEPGWSVAPLLIVTFASQILLDAAVTGARAYFGSGIPPSNLLEEARATYMVDALLTPIGFLIALEASRTPAALALALPLLALISLFARERVARIQSALTLSSTYQGTAELLGEVLSTSDEYTGHHSRSVLVLAHQVAEEMGLDEIALREVEFGALLHDIGKLAIPQEIINKPGALTPAEMDLMRTHTLEGARMLTRIGGLLGDTGPVIRAHHENFDGSGYPDGLCGETIPVAARVIRCCDAFNAMTNDRPYRKAMSIEKAIRELRAHAGTQFDPDAVEALVKCVAAWKLPAAATTPARA